MTGLLGNKSIQQLVAELCPYGVEHKKLEDVVELNFGARVTKKDDAGVLYPVYGGGGESFRVDKFNREDEYVVSRFAMSANCVRRVKGKFWMLDSGFTFTPADIKSVSKAFVYHFLYGKQYEIYNMARGGGQKNLDVAQFKAIIVPVPPLPIQEAIVSYLDKFSQLEAELEAELVRRQKQYEWYRMHLLDFKRKEVDEDGKATGAVLDYQYGAEYQARSAIEKIREMVEELCPDGVQWKKLSDIATVKTGSKNAQDAVEDGVYPFYIRSQSIKHISSFTHDTTAILVPGEGGVGKIFHYAEGKFSVHQRVYCIAQFSPDILPRFVYFYMQQAFGNYVSRKSIRGTVESLRLPMFNDFEIPVLPLPVQQTIVTLLDHFDTLVNDISEGLPAEIAARRKQYEYYREQLLSFEPKVEEAAIDG